mgnify:CR=1 FL=1
MILLCNAMQPITLSPLQTYLTRLQSLLADVERWSQARGLLLQRDAISLNEEAYGVYRADTLRLLTPAGSPIAALIPVGASIIGAKGRVDLEGTIDQAILVDWDAGGPQFETSVHADGQVERRPQPIYRHVDEPGWYWVESRPLARAHKLDESLFFELLFLVSEYDLRR